MLPANITKFKAAVETIAGRRNDLIPDEQEAFAALKDYWRHNDFSPEVCKTHLDKMAKGKNKRPGDLKFSEVLQEFRRLCFEYYRQDKAVFEAFQMAMGGKSGPQPKPRPQPQTTQQQQQQPKPNPQPHPKNPPDPSNRINYPNGDYYIGEIKNNKPNGKGKMFRANGNWEEGVFVNGDMHGQGASYNGYHKRNDRGQYNYGKRTGKGVMTWSDGDRYEGEWNENGANGKGQYKFANGSWQNGTFLDGKLHGRGTRYDVDNRRKTTGNFDGDKLNGNVEYLWDNGDSFKGRAYANAYDYISGTYIYKNGKREKGEFYNGKWQKRVSWMEKLGEWFWTNIWLLPAIFGIIYLIKYWMERHLISGLFWGAVAFCVVAVVVYVLEKAKEFFESLPRWVRNTFWIVLAAFILYNVLSGMFGTVANLFKSSEKPAPVVVETLPIAGRWSGTLAETNRSITLELEITGSSKENFAARMTIHASTRVTHEYAGRMTDNKLFLENKAKSGNYSGDFEGVVSEGNTVLSGQYKRGSTVLNFQMKKMD